MKPVSFEYFRPDNLTETLELLGMYGEDAIILAGGLSLGPMLNMRLVRPEIVIDINAIPQLSKIEVDRKYLRTGALVSQAEVLYSEKCRQYVPLLTTALQYVGHYQTRSRGTLAGSVAHADPSAEIPLCLVALGGKVELRSHNKRRYVEAKDFFLGSLTTAIAEDELITSLLWPIAPPSSVSCFDEISQRRGDFAIVAAAAWATCDGNEYSYHLGIGGVEDRPVCTKGHLTASHKQFSSFTERVASNIVEKLDVINDQRASAEYRRNVAIHIASSALSKVLKSLPFGDPS